MTTHTEVMECRCGSIGTIRETETADDWCRIRCDSCGFTMEPRGIAFVMWRFRATKEDPYGDQEK